MDEKFNEPPPPYVISVPAGGQNPMIIAVPHGGGPVPVQGPGYIPEQMAPPYAAIQGPSAGQQIQTTIVLAQGNCPNCRTGFLVERYTNCGVLCAICFFPLGLVCCLMMKEQKCGACGYCG